MQGPIFAVGAEMHPLDPTSDPLVPPRRFRVEEYHRLIAARVLDEDEHVELLEGVIVQMTPQASPHARIITELTHHLASKVGDGFRVRVQLPLTLGDDSEPEPDLAVVTREEQDAAEEHPRTAVLVIEVSGDSLKRDRLVKGRVYARARIDEYWVVNVPARTVEVYRDPDPVEGRFRSMRTFGPDEVLVPNALETISIPVAGLFDRV